MRAILAGFEEAGQLHSFHTTLSFRQSDWLVRFAPEPLKNDLLRRSFDIPPERCVLHPGRELVRLGSARLGLSFLTGGKEGWASIDAIYTDLDRQVGDYLRACFADRTATPGTLRTPEAVYCYEDSALKTFQAATELGLKRYYDLPIAYWETVHRLLLQEAERLPRWEPTLGATSDPPQKLARKCDEISLSDVVICPSHFVLDSLPDTIRKEKTCLVSEFGSPQASAIPERAQESGLAAAKLRVLFAGSLSQRKGLADVFQAIQILKRKDVELIVLGSLIMPLDFYRKECPSFTYEPPRPHDEVLNLMSTCDILVLPSIVEGRALVQQEAMMCGLPLIVTPNAGGCDLIEEGETGFLVPVASPEVIAEKISWFADHPGRLASMRQKTRKKAEALTWQDYARKILNTCLSRQ